MKDFRRLITIIQKGGSASESIEIFIRFINFLKKLLPALTQLNQLLCLINIFARYKEGKEDKATLEKKLKEVSEINLEDGGILYKKILIIVFELIIMLVKRNVK